MDKLNDLMRKNEIYPIESFISFPVHRGVITAFISYDSFPNSVVAKNNK